MALSEDFPPYCCIILADFSSEGALRLFFEARGEDAAVAPNRLTCFGGKRERNESPSDCIVRECQEEMGSEWLPEQPLQRACDLYVDDTLIAWFFVAKAPSTDDIQRMTFEAGRNAVWTTAHDQRISTWHAAVLRAWQAGQRIAVVNSSTEEARIALAVKLRQLPSSDESPTRRIDVD